MTLIISSYNICKMPYHQPGGRITWSECTLRKWLNNDFINGDFTQAERARILPCNLCYDNNTEYKTPGGAPTTFCENKKQIAGFIGTVKNIL